jgi:hypothetical protein
MAKGDFFFNFKNIGFLKERKLKTLPNTPVQSLRRVRSEALG